MRARRASRYPPTTLSAPVAGLPIPTLTSRRRPEAAAARIDSRDSRSAPSRSAPITTSSPWRTRAAARAAACRRLLERGARASSCRPARASALGAHHGDGQLAAEVEPRRRGGTTPDLLGAPRDQPLDQVARRPPRAPAHPQLLAQIPLGGLGGDRVHRLVQPRAEREGGLAGEVGGPRLSRAGAPVLTLGDPVGVEEWLERDPLVDAACDPFADHGEVAAVAADPTGEHLAEKARGLDRQRLEVGDDVGARGLVLGDLGGDPFRHRPADRAVTAQQRSADLLDAPVV